MTNNIDKNIGNIENIDPNENKLLQEMNFPSFKGNKDSDSFPIKNDFFDEIIKELEGNKNPNKVKENKPNNNILNNTTNININDDNIYDFKISKSKDKIQNKEDTQFVRMQKLREGLQIQPHFDFGIPLNENASLSIIQKYKDKKEINENFQKTLSKINILKWLKVYTILMNKEIQNVNYCLNQIKKMYSFDFNKSSVLCEVKNIYIIDCYQLLDVIDANFITKKIILTKNIKKNSKDKGKIKILLKIFKKLFLLICSKLSKK